MAAGFSLQAEKKYTAHCLYSKAVCHGSDRDRYTETKKAELRGL